MLSQISRAKRARCNRCTHEAAVETLESRRLLAAVGPFGTYTVTTDVLDQKLTSASWDRGRINLAPIRKDAGGNLYWSYDGDWTSPSSDHTTWGSADGFASIPNDRNWTLYMYSAVAGGTQPAWMWSSTPGVPVNWTDYENVIRWTVNQLPPQVKVIEVDNEPSWGAGKEFPNVGAMADYVKHTYNAIKSSARSDLIVASPASWTAGPSRLDEFNTLANYTWGDGHYTFDYVDAIAQHHYTDWQDTRWADANTKAKQFGLWYTQLEEWYANLRSSAHIDQSKPTYFTEFGYTTFIGGANPRPDHTQAQQADNLAKSYVALRAMGASMILGFDMEGYAEIWTPDGYLPPTRGTTSDDFSMINLDLSKRPSWYSSDFATTWLLNVGTGTGHHTRTLFDGYYVDTVEFGDRSVIWTENPTAFAFNGGKTLAKAQDEYGANVAVTDGATVTISQSPVFLTYSTPNWVTNPGFEADGSQAPIGWKTWTAVPADTDVDYADGFTGNPAHSGARKLVHYRGSSGWNNVYTYQTIKGLSNGTYTLSAWVRATTGLSAQMVAKEYASGNPPYLTTAIPISGAYVQISQDVTVSNGQVQVGFQSTNASAGATMFVDDVSLTLKNLIPTNPGFESAGGQSPPGWATWVGNAADYDVDYADNYAGNPAHSGSYKLAHYRASSGWGIVYTYRNVTGLATGTYRVSAWVRASAGLTSPQMLIKSYQAGQPNLSVPIPESSNWVRITKDVYVTSGTLQVGFQSQSATAGKTMLVDDVSVTFLSASQQQSAQQLTGPLTVDGGSRQAGAANTLLTPSLDESLLGTTKLPLN